MQRFAPALFMLAALARGACHGSEAPAPPRDAGAAPQGSFSVVDVLDFGRHSMHNFAFSKATQDMFVSFGDRWDTEVASVGDGLQQWGLGPSKGVLIYSLDHTYHLEPGWLVDHVTPSPDGHWVVVRMYRKESTGSGHWGKYALLDAVKHARVPGDLEPYDERGATIQWSTGGQRLRISYRPMSSGSEPQHIVYGMGGLRVPHDPSEFPPPEKGKLWVIESSKTTYDTHGLYYTDGRSQDHRVEPQHWHDNYGITRDGRYVATTTWDGEVKVYDTAEDRFVFKQKIASAYGFLAYDEKKDRFLIGDATHDGTTMLRSLGLRRAQ